MAKHSIRAATIYFYGTVASDSFIKTEACKWYSVVLRGLYGLLSQNIGPFSEDCVYKAVMPTHFENLAGTSGCASFEHVRGAAMMIEAGGPESCRDGSLHQIFRHLRLLTVSPSG